MTYIEYGPIAMFLSGKSDVIFSRAKRLSEFHQRKHSAPGLFLEPQRGFCHKRQAFLPS